jgi:hypothetical protein
MRIFIDEAGPFVVPTSAQSLFSLVLALVIPSWLEDELFAEFSQLRDGWRNFGRLLVADRRTPFLQFGQPDGGSQRMHGQVEKVWPALKTGNKEMLVRR